MNTSLPRIAPASPVAAVHTPQAGAPARSTPPERAPERAAPARPFADMLRQRRADASPAAASPTPTPARDEPAATAAPTGTEPDVDGSASTPDTDRATTPAKGRPATSSKLAVRHEKSEAEPTLPEIATATEAAPEPAVDRGPSAADAPIARPLPLHDDAVAIALPQRIDTAAASAAEIGDDGHRRDAGGAAVPAASAPEPVSGRTAAVDARAAPGERSTTAEPSTPSPAEPAVLVEDRASKADAGAHRSPPEIQSPQATLALATTTLPTPLAAGARTPVDGPVPTLAVPTPVDSPLFAGALGVHVGVLVKGGVQHAELHLNPAEMGPVSIRIELEGNAAQVQFGADLAETRHAIERGLPELASALRDAGFTLSGGGVSQHGSQRGGAGGDPGTTSPTARAAFLHGEAEALLGADAARTVRAVAAGGVDVYA